MVSLIAPRVAMSMTHASYVVMILGVCRLDVEVRS
jgi:hypothetical protein